MGKHEDAARSRRGPGDTRATSARRRATLSTFDVTPHKNLACQSWGGADGGMGPGRCAGPLVRFQRVTTAGCPARWPPRCLRTPNGARRDGKTACVCRGITAARSSPSRRSHGPGRTADRAGDRLRADPEVRQDHAQRKWHKEEAGEGRSLSTLSHSDHGESSDSDVRRPVRRAGHTFAYTRKPTMSGQSASSVVLEVSGCARVYITDRCCL
jgi:hypothetical protein